jgi:hypothetical protein
MACKWVRFAYRFLPLPAWRAFLLDRHIDRCPHCQAHALDDRAVRPLGVTPADLAAEPPLFAFATDCRRPRGKTFRDGWRYAFGLLLVAAILWVAVAISRFVPFGNLPHGTVTVTQAGSDDCVFAVIEAKIGNEPARPVIFKPRQPGMMIVWFEKIIN